MRAELVHPCLVARSNSTPSAFSDLQAFARRKRTPTAVCLGLERMVSETTMQDLRQLSVTFDPFTSLPEFLDDGTLETRLAWEATKPGRLQAFLDVNRNSGNTGGYNLLMGKIEELGLQDALGPDGCSIAHQGGVVENYEMHVYAHGACICVCKCNLCICVCARVGADRGACSC